MSRIAELKQNLKGYTKVELEHFYLCLEGCLAGLGATVISIYMIEKELEWNLLKKFHLLCKIIQPIFYFLIALLRKIHAKPYF